MTLDFNQIPPLYISKVPNNWWSSFSYDSRSLCEVYFIISICIGRNGGPERWSFPQGDSQTRRRCAHHCLVLRICLHAPILTKQENTYGALISQNPINARYPHQLLVSQNIVLPSSWCLRGFHTTTHTSSVNVYAPTWPLCFLPVKDDIRDQFKILSTGCTWMLKCVNDLIMRIPVTSPWFWVSFPSPIGYESQ